jgi:hypothetical protein
LKPYERSSRIWRSGRAGKSPIRDELWSAAIKAARQEGVNRTAQQLHLDAGKLKRLLVAADGRGRRAPRKPRFVELIAPLLLPLPVKRRIDVNLEKLDLVLDGARQAPLSEPDYDKLKDALHAMAALLARSRNTEKMNTVVGDAAGAGARESGHSDATAPPPAGHGRNRATASLARAR